MAIQNRPAEEGVAPPCGLCGGRTKIEIPLDEPGKPKLPPHPERLRNFVYGCAKGLAEAEKPPDKAKGRGGAQRR